MNKIFLPAAYLIILLFTMNTKAQSESKNVPADWQTHAEKTDYRETPRYAETIEFSKRLADASPLDRIPNIRNERRRQSFAASHRFERQNIFARTSAKKRQSRHPHPSLHSFGRIGRQRCRICAFARYCDHENAR